MPLTIALTGSIGSGKSAAAEIFKVLGATIIDADLLAREVVSKGSKGLRSIASTFGKDYLLHDGTLDRKKLGNLVFSDPNQKARLEGILHPLIREEFQKRLRLSFEKGDNFICYVVPLFFEANLSREDFDFVVVVSSKKETALQRIKERDGLSAEEALRRYDVQLPIEEKEKKADFVIQNNGTRLDLEREVRRLFIELTSRTSPT